MNYRHGDLLIREIKKLPKNLKKKAGNILAEGEATGHHHQLVAEKLQLLEDSKGRLYFKVEKPSPLTHQEHKTITVEPGVYVVEREREYDYALESIKRVID